MQLFQSRILCLFLLNPHLVPLLDHSILRLAIVHERVADCTSYLLAFLSQHPHCIVDLPSLVFGKEENLVGPLNEYLLLGPETGYIADLFKDFIILKPQNDNLVLQDGEFEDPVEP